MIDIEELRRLEREATKGPWQLEWLDTECAAVNEPHADIFRQIRGADGWEPATIACATFNKEDAVFVVASRNDLPQLLSEVERLRASLAACEAERDAVKRGTDDLHRAFVALDQRLAALVGSLPVCSQCGARATHELYGGTEGAWYRCDEHHGGHWAESKELDWAPFIRSIPATGERGKEKA